MRGVTQELYRKDSIKYELEAARAGLSPANVQRLGLTRADVAQIVHDFKFTLGYSGGI
jgi:hypothetical protein